jgi:hypothetical protein
MKTYRTNMERYIEKCLEIQKKTFELAKNGNLSCGIYLSLLEQDKMYGSFIKKEKDIQD